MAAKRVNAKKKKNVMDRISIQRIEIDAFLNRIVTAEEEWVTYDNVNRKRT